jgi:HK97 family phage prohead protease
MDKKVHRGSVELKAEGPEGSFRATIASFSVIDKDGDVLLPGSFIEGQPVRIAAWGHNWNVPVIGRGAIHQDDFKAWCDGQFFLDTQSGMETYKAVKNLGDLQEWSFGFDVTKQSFGKFEDRDVRFIEGFDTHEVSPVFLGAGINTGTDVIKGLEKSERKQLSKMKAQLTGMIATIDGMLGDGAEDPDAGKAEEPETVKAEDQAKGKADGERVPDEAIRVQIEAALAGVGL